MLSEFQNKIPEGEPDLKIGPLLLWVSGYADISQRGNGEMGYLRTPTLLKTENIIAFSANSETPVFVFKQFLKDIDFMYNSISTEHIAEYVYADSEFRIRLMNNTFGQIKITITYYSWLHNGSLEFEDQIDQSYLPKIISEMKQILARFT